MRYITIVFAFCILGIWLFNVKTLREVTSLEKELKIANENLEELEKIYGYDYEYIELNILKGLCITRNNYK